jgi:hypothetical protein
MAASSSAYRDVDAEPDNVEQDAQQNAADVDEAHRFGQSRYVGHCRSDVHES